MQLFSRSVMMAGPFNDVMGYAADMRAYVSDKIGREVSLWSAMFGAPLGSMVYSARVEGLADLQSIGATLAGDAAYHAKLDAGRALSAGPAQDNLLTPVHGELGDPPPVGSVAVVTTAVIGNGRYADAVGWGIEIAQHVQAVSGMPTMFLVDDYGTFGQVTWIGVAVDAAAADAAGAAINTNADYIAKVSAGAGLFVPGSGHRALIARVA